MKSERMKLESSVWNWTVRAEVGKDNWNWKVTDGVWKFWLNLESINAVRNTFQLKQNLFNFRVSNLKLSNCGKTFQLRRNFPTSKEAFQLRSVLSNFDRFFPTSLGSFQLVTFQLLVLSNCPFQLHESRFFGWFFENLEFGLDFVSRNDTGWYTQNIIFF